MLTADTYVSVEPDLARDAAEATAHLVLKAARRIPGSRRVRHRAATPSHSGGAGKATHRPHMQNPRSNYMKTPVPGPTSAPPWPHPETGHDKSSPFNKGAMTRKDRPEGMLDVLPHVGRSFGGRWPEPTRDEPMWPSRRHPNPSSCATMMITTSASSICACAPKFTVRLPRRRSRRPVDPMQRLQHGHSHRNRRQCRAAHSSGALPSGASTCAHSQVSSGRKRSHAARTSDTS